MCNVFREDMWITIFWTVRNIVPFHSNKWKLFCPNFYWIFPVMCQFFVSWWSYSDCLSHSVTQPGEITSRRSSTKLAHVWNKAVDETLGRLVVYLSSRGWWFKHHFEHGKWGGAQGSARLSSHCCAETQLMYLTFLCTRSWTCFVLKASPVTYLCWIWLILPYIVPWTRI